MDSEKAPPNSGGEHSWIVAFLLASAHGPRTRRCGSKENNCPHVHVWPFFGQNCETVADNGCGHQPGGVHTTPGPQRCCKFGFWAAPGGSESVELSHKIMVLVYLGHLNIRLLVTGHVYRLQHLRNRYALVSRTDTVGYCMSNPSSKIIDTREAKGSAQTK